MCMPLHSSRRARHSQCIHIEYRNRQRRQMNVYFSRLFGFCCERFFSAFVNACCVASAAKQNVRKIENGENFCQFSAFK